MGKVDAWESANVRYPLMINLRGYSAHNCTRCIKVLPVSGSGQYIKVFDSIGLGHVRKLPVT